MGQVEFDAKITTLQEQLGLLIGKEPTWDNAQKVRRLAQEAMMLVVEIEEEEEKNEKNQ